jgi:hypothetical protein
MPDSSYGGPWFEGDTPGAHQETGSGGPDSLAWGDITGKPDTATRWPAWLEISPRPIDLDGFGLLDEVIEIVSGAVEALDLDEITGSLDAAKLYGDADLDSIVVDILRVNASLRATEVGAFSDPEFETAPAVGFEGGVARISFSADGTTSDTYVGRIASGVFGGLVGTLNRADELGGSGQNSAYHLNREYHTGTQPFTTLTGLPDTLAGHGITNLPTTLAGWGITDAASDAELTAHEADTTDVHGITDTTKLAKINVTNVWAVPQQFTYGSPTIFQRTTTAGQAFAVRVEGDTTARCSVMAGGNVVWSGGGTSSIDNRLTRIGSASMRFDDNAGGAAKVHVTGELKADGALNHDGTMVGHRGAMPVAMPAAYTQLYATADRTHASRTAAALTDSVGGTVGTTVAAIPDPTDAPATADALRDELVTAILPTIRNALSSIIDQVNKGRADHLDTAQVVNALIDDAQLQGDAQ